MSVFTFFSDKGNFFDKEASDTEAARAYRNKCRFFHSAYSRLCTAYNRTGVLDYSNPVLVKPVTDFFQPGTEIRAAQMAPLVIGSTFGRGAMFLGMGRGKTFLGGYWANYLMRYSPLSQQFPNNKFLVLCPKSVVDEWRKQLPSFFQCTVNVFPDTRDLDADIIVTNYEQLENLMPYRHEFGGIILDESHRAKNVDTKTFKLVSEFVDMNIYYRFVLSGTPMTNKPDDLFSQLTFIDPYAMGFSYEYMKSTYFKSVYMGKGKGGFFKEVFLKKYEDLIRRCVMGSSIIQSSTSEEVDKVISHIECPQSEEQRKAIEDISKGYTTIQRRQEIMGGKTQATMVELKAAVGKELQVSSGFLIAGDTTLHFPSPKMAKALEIVQAHPGKQFIIWTYFRETTLRMTRALPGAECIFGTTPAKQRTRIKEDFERGDLRILVLQIRAGNTGLNLQMCNMNIFVESDWAPTVIDQAMCRTARSGQTEKVHFWFLYTKDTADTLVINVGKGKKTLSRSLLAAYVANKTALTRSTR